MKKLIIITLLLFSAKSMSSSVDSETLEKVLNSSAWIYDIETKTLKLCFYLDNSNIARCTTVPDKYIVIPITESNSI